MFDILMFQFQDKNSLIINKILKPIIESYEKVKTDYPDSYKDNENIISKHIVWYLKQESSIKDYVKRRTITVYFRPKEHLDSDTLYEPDIKINIGITISLEIESKRLHEGNDWTITEYLNENGLGRFLVEYYSQNEIFGGMIAYIQKGNFTQIKTKLCEGISQKECRNSENIPTIHHGLISIHQKENGTIQMYHLFFEF